MSSSTVLCSSPHCIRSPTYLVDNYCIGISLRCGYCKQSTISYYDTNYCLLPELIYPQLVSDFWNNQIKQVHSISEVFITDREQGPYYQYFKLTAAHKKTIQGLFF
jgi:hypothetical protein